ncbi:MAG: hypothetical protein R3E97_12100 [Candidatus Eisenbacteria bacterium]
MRRTSTRILTDLITASRLPSFRIGAVVPLEAPAPVSVPTPVPAPAPTPGPSLPDSENGAPSDWNLDALTGRFVELSSAGASVALTAVSALVVEAQLRREPAAWVAIGESTFYPPDLAEVGCDLDALPVVRVPDARTAARAADLLLRSGGFRLVVIDGVGSPYVRTRRLEPSRTRFYPGYGPTYSDSADRQVADMHADATYLDRFGSSADRARAARTGSSADRARDTRRYVPNEMRSRGFSGDALADGTRAFPRSASNAGRFGGPHHRETSASIPSAAQTRLAGLTKRHRAVLVCVTYKEHGAASLGALVSLRGTGKVRKTSFDRFTWELEALKDKRRAPGWEHSGVCRGPTGLF